MYIQNVKVTKENYIGIGYFIKCRRQVLGIGREDFAQMMDISLETLDRWEEDYLEPIGLEEIKKLSHYLNYYPLIFIEGLPARAYLCWESFIREDYIHYGK